MYNTGECVEISGPVEPVVFEQALRWGVAEAEALRARVVVDGDEPRQVVEPEVDFPLPCSTSAPRRTRGRARWRGCGPTSPSRSTRRAGCSPPHY
ncbi:hypothetical protein ACFQ0O_04855 [Saccharopolyspora spinosporotrichia]|uniref:hypothetical protein n=1 Tax=Saccharopolyspora erythraea TaxID=1836 RepID=UPI0022B223D1|nr:hypothetical protein [Saccharopolyspora erythraea]